MIFGKFVTLKENDLLLDNTILLVLSKIFIQRRLDYFFISNSLQESIKTTITLAAFPADHSPITFSLCHLKEFPQGRGLWKFNKSLIKNENYHEQMKKLIKIVLNNLNQDNIVDPHFRWEYLKFEIKNFFKRYCVK